MDINGRGEYGYIISKRMLLISLKTGCDRPTLNNLVIHVIPVVNIKWFELGVVLLNPQYHHTLSTIEVDAGNDAKTCCKRMFSKWLDTDELASWDKLINALRTVELNTVASNIKSSLQGE